MNSRKPKATSNSQNIPDFSSILTLPVIPLLPMVASEEVAIRVAEAFRNAGLLQIEITFRSPVALKALRRVVREFPEMTVGAGTLLRPEQVREAVDAGAAFGVAPGANLRVMQAAREEGLPFLPGVATPSEVEMALEEGFLWQKIPGVLGNFMANLDWYQAAYAHTGLRFVPTGGPSVNQLPRFFRHPIIGAMAGVWATPPNLLNEEKWDVIGALASRLVKVVSQSQARVGQKKSSAPVSKKSQSDLIDTHLGLSNLA